MSNMENPHISDNIDNNDDTDNLSEVEVEVNQRESSSASDSYLIQEDEVKEVNIKIIDSNKTGNK